MPKSERRLSDELEVIVKGKFPAMEKLPNFIYTRRIIDEAPRFYPPGWAGMTRRAKERSGLGDYFVSAGTEISLRILFKDIRIYGQSQIHSMLVRLTHTPPRASVCL